MWRVRPSCAAPDATGSLCGGSGDAGGVALVAPLGLGAAPADSVARIFVEFEPFGQRPNGRLIERRIREARPFRKGGS